MPSSTISFSILPSILSTISAEIHPRVRRSGVADDVARRGAGRLSNIRAPLAGVISGSALKLAALGSHGGEIGRSRVRGKGLSVDSREVEPGLTRGVNGQLQLILVGVRHLLVGRALQNGTDVVLRVEVSS